MGRAASVDGISFSFYGLSWTVVDDSMARSEPEVMSAARTGTAVFRVLDALDHPHGGRILRLRLQEGDPPTVKELKGARLRATSPDGDTREVTVEGFAAFGGKPSDERLARSGRIDVRVLDADEKRDPPVGMRWEVTGPLA